MLYAPLKKMSLTQPFGVNWTGDPDFYTRIGLKAHNGWDLSSANGNEVFAVTDGEATDSSASGYGISIRLLTGNLEIVFGHLKQVLKSGTVKAGDLIAYSDNTGYSTGPHLHIGVRPYHYRYDGSGPYYDAGDNGYFGYVDPGPFFGPGIFDLPVDKQYGFTARTPGVPSEIVFFPSQVYFFRTQKRLMTSREYKALRFGFWDLRLILDPAMYGIWTEMTKVEAIKRGILKGYGTLFLP